ncbi:MAG: hypothetical protein ACRDS0_05635 [Pseudonocardiaceae bacterium]
MSHVASFIDGKDAVGPDDMGKLAQVLVVHIDDVSLVQPHTVGEVE